MREKSLTWVAGAKRLGHAPAFLAAFAGSWVGSGAVRTWTHAHMRCWCGMKPINPLHHNASPISVCLDEKVAEEDLMHTEGKPARRQGGEGLEDADIKDWSDAVRSWGVLQKREEMRS